MKKRAWSIVLVWALLAASFSGLAPAAYADEGEPAPAEQPAPVYAEDFEEGFGLFTSRFGTMEITDEEKHSGQYGVRVGSNVSAQGIWYKHDRLLEDWSVTAWVYDDMSQSINIIHFQETDTATRDVNFWVGYNVSAQGEANYSTRFGNTHATTSAARSLGWHEFTIVNDFTGDMELRVYVDGVLSMTGIAFKMRTVTMGNFWSDKNTSTTRYWDDFTLYDTVLVMPDSGGEPGEENPVREPVEGKAALGYKAEVGLSAIAQSLLLSLKSPDVIVNDTKDMLDRTNPLVLPIEKPGGVLVPAELFANSLGGQLAWDDEARTLAIGYQGHEAVLKEGESQMLLDGSPVSLSQAAAVVGGRLYAPLKEIARELFSKQVTVKESGLIVVDAAQVELTPVEEEQILAHFNRPGQLLFVAADGDDSNVGTLEEPYRTLEAARDRIRSIKAADGLPDGGITVYVRGGDYSRTEPFVLEEQDSGTEASPVRYAGYSGEKARIHGGVIIPGASFGPVAEQDVLDRLSPEAVNHIKVADLAALGVTAGQIGDIAYQGHGIAIEPSESELFIDNKPMIRARYPNEGYLKITEVVREGSIPRAGDMSGITPIFKFRDPGGRVQAWADVSAAWIYGFPKYQWADNTIGVKTIDPATLTMELDQPSYYGVGIGQGFYFFNVLEELDQPGEWYLDKDNLKAYVYAEEALEDVETAITLTDGDLVDFRNASHIIWENFDLAYTRKNAVNMTGGHDIRLEGNRIYNTGEKAIMAGNYPVADEYDVNSTDRGGRSYTIKSNDIFNIGKGAIHISGGDRQTLEAGNMLVENNHIWNYARLRMEDGIKMFGVGNTISHNKIHDAPKKAIQFGGNDMVVEYNEIYDVLYSVDDMGAVYMGRDLTYQGNVVRHNFFHNITGPGHSGLGVHAVYFDDFTSYGEVYGNLMYKVQNPIKYNGGSGHQTYNNIIYKGTAHSGWYADVNNNSSNANFTTGVLADNLQRVPYESPVWQARYPHLVAFINGNPAVPRNNVFDGNAVIQHKPIGRYHPGYGGVVSNTYETQEEVGFLDEDSLNFNLPEDSAVYQQIPGFVPLQFDRMGMYADQYRTAAVQVPAIAASPSEEPNEGENGEEGTGGNKNPSAIFFPSPEPVGTDNGRGVVVRISASGEDGQFVEGTVTEASIAKARQANPAFNGAAIQLEELLGTNTIRLPVSSWTLLAENQLRLIVQSPRLRLEIAAGQVAAVAKAEAGDGAEEEWIELVLEKAADAQADSQRQLTGKDLYPIGPVIHIGWRVTDGKDSRVLAGMEQEELQGVWSYTEAELRQLAEDWPEGTDLRLLGVRRLDERNSGWQYARSKPDSANNQVQFTGFGQGSFSLMLANPQFADMSGHWASEAVRLLAARSVIDGFADGAFQPDGDVTRAQFTAMLVKALGLQELSAGSGYEHTAAAEAEGFTAASGFSDVKAGAWYAEYIAAAVAGGLIQGYSDGTFLPEVPVTRTEMSVMLIRAGAKWGETLVLDSRDIETALALYKDLDDIPAWSRSYVAQAIKLGMAQGISEQVFAPELTATRAQAATMLKRLLEQHGQLGT